MTYEIYSHPEQPMMQVEVILASKPKGDDHKPIYTIRMRYPRCIHGEIMTHRVFGRNARSSRAVPFKTMMAELMSTPFIPWHRGKNISGMQAGEELDEYVYDSSDVDKEFPKTFEEAWLNARTFAVNQAKEIADAGYHKQIVNRLIEPFAWIDTLITSTEWSNFLWLRDHEHAEPHLQDLARLVKKAIEEAEVKVLEDGEWHMPYITDEDIQNLIVRPDEDTEHAIDELGCDSQELLNMVSAARCARISYKPFDGNAAYRAEFDRYNMLVSSDRVHASPLEHQARADHKSTNSTEWLFPHLHGNLVGYIQARKLVSNENHS